MKISHIITALILAGILSACSSLKETVTNNEDLAANVSTEENLNTYETESKNLTIELKDTAQERNQNISELNQDQIQSTENLDSNGLEEPGINIEQPGSTANNNIPLDNSYPFQTVEPRFSVIEKKQNPKTQASEEQADDHLFQRIVKDFYFEIPDNSRVKKHRAFYLDNLEYVERVLERSRPYLFFIVEEIEKRGLPMELAMLPAIESAFLTKATSKSNAAGLWQFIPATGRYFGLKQNWWSDQRRDVILSTQSALDYLKELSIEFNGDWYLAIAAYNGGRGTIARAIKKNKALDKPTDYFDLKLSKETSNYVPKLLAFVDILRHAHIYNLKIPEIPDFPYFTMIKTPGQIDMTELIDKTAVNEDIFYQLNAGFKRWASSPEGPHRLVIPVESSKDVENYLSSQPKAPNIRWKNHKLKRGDTLYGLARQYKVSIKAIQTINKMKSSHLREGKTILIPLRSA